MGNLVMGERYIPGLAGWPESARRMFEANYTWASSLASDKTVLDCACGSGYGSAILAARARTVVGADVDPRMVEHARQTYADAGVRFEQFSITEIPYPDGYFDLVVSFDTIEHVRDDHRVLLELKRVTRADGAIVLSTPLANYPKEQGEPDLWDATHVREYSAYEWLHLLGQYFEAAEFFCRDAPDFGIRPLPLEAYTGSAFDLAFVRLGNAPAAVKHPNVLDAFKHVHCLHLCQTIKEYERARAELASAPPSVPGGPRMGLRALGRVKRWLVAHITTGK
jgi:SAM-dependent methyltransferase